MRKRVFGHMRTAKAYISLRLRQSNQDLRCSLRNSWYTTKYINGEQRIR